MVGCTCKNQVLTNVPSKSLMPRLILIFSGLVLFTAHTTHIWHKKALENSSVHLFVVDSAVHIAIPYHCSKNEFMNIIFELHDIVLFAP